MDSPTELGLVEDSVSAMTHFELPQGSSASVRRLRTLKRRKESEKLSQKIKHQVKLERVLGLTVPSNAGLACAPSAGLIAYPAGCTVVLYNPRKNRQSHVINQAKKTITALDFSNDGKFLVTGECGHLPMVRIWDVGEKQSVADFPGHKFGINCVAFSPNGKYVVSVGSQHDMIVNVWDWRTNTKVASNKVSTKVKAISFAENGSYFVTAGNRHVKFWYLEYSRSKYKEPVPLMGRSAILGEQRNNYFCDVACGRGEMGDSTYAITKSGLLCEFNNRRLLDKWVELRTDSANCLVVGEDFVFIGCADGIVRCFSPHTLQFITTLPRTHFLGVDVSKGLTINHMASHPSQAKYPDAMAITFDEQNFKVTVVYNDHSVYVWDVRDIKKVGKSHSFIYHSACIWGLEMYPLLGNDPKAVLPAGSFITCSSDDTIRIWNLSSNMASNTLYKRNIYSEELLKTIYIDSELNCIKELNSSNPDAGNKENYDQRNGVRCIRISHDGRHLASGDRAGNIRVHELQFMDELCKIEAHDAEVLCLQFSGPLIQCQDGGKGGQTVGSGSSSSKPTSLLASASRDRLIHVFDASRDYGFVHTLDDHSSSITAVKFIKSQSSECNVQMVSCGADKSIIFRDINLDKKGSAEFQRGNNVVGKTTLYDMEVDYNHKHILTACQDRNIRVYSVANGKHSRTFKGSTGEDGTLIKVTLDRSGLYLATSCTDKTLAIYDYCTGDCKAVMLGHSELVTGLKFTHDCRHLISVSGDGCIFVWRLPQDMTSSMLSRLSQLSNPAASKCKPFVASHNVSPEPLQDLMEPHPISQLEDSSDSYRFSLGKLPVWAKKQIVERTGSLTPPSPPSALQRTGQQPADYPKGRWAQKMGMGQGITMKSHYDSDSIIPFPPTPPDSKESSSLEGHRRSTGPSAKQTYFDDLGEEYNSFSEIENHRGFSPYQQGRVTFKDGLLLHANGQRPRTVTDDSSLGSFNIESPEQDADIDESSDGLTTQDDGGESTEPEHMDRTLFFGQVDEMPSNYTVNATDVEKLRRWHQNQVFKKGRFLTTDTTTTPSQESDFDDEDEESSTPSADQANKAFLTNLSVSSENVDLVGRRERFLQSNFGSLSLSDQVSKASLHNSISNQCREGSAMQRNAVTIARAQSLRDQDQNRRREELRKRIEETRKKLQNIGYHSMMRGSQSISDLSNMNDSVLAMRPPNRPGSSAGIHLNRVDANRGQNSSLCLTDDEEGSLRRTCSLSDLNRPRRLLPAPPVTVSGKKANKSSEASSPSHEMVSKANGSQGCEDIPSYMRSTSASTKKERQAVAGIQPLQRRRSSLGQAQSTSDLRSAVKDEDTSSEEYLMVEDRTVGRRRNSGGASDDTRCKLSPRRLGLAAVNGMTRSERDLTKVTKVRVKTKENASPGLGTTLIKQRTKLKTTTMIVSENHCGSSGEALMSSNSMVPMSSSETSCSPYEVDVVRAPLNWHLAEQTALKLQKASDDLVQLYKRISLDYDLEEASRRDLLHRLASTAGLAQHTLKPVIPSAYALTQGELSSVAKAMMSASKALTGPGQVPPMELQKQGFVREMNYSNMTALQCAMPKPLQNASGSQTNVPMPSAASSRAVNHGPSWC